MGNASLGGQRFDPVNGNGSVAVSEGELAMKIDQGKLPRLLARHIDTASRDHLRREENVFFVGGNLPERPTVETLFDSHYQCHAALFHLTFGDPDSFANGETLARVIKKNFNVHLVGRFDYPATPQLIERAYAAGVDIVDLPLTVFDSARGVDSRYPLKERLGALDRARSIFPRWSVLSTLLAGVEPSSSTVAGIDALLARDVVPLVALSGRAAGMPSDELSGIYAHLINGWRQKKAAIKPLLPLIYLSTPLVPASPPGALRGFIDLIDDRRLLATSDLRRLLRVKEVEESFASSGL